MAAFAPQWPEPREEKWFFFVADPQTNEVCSPVEHISLVEAEFLSADAVQVTYIANGLAGPRHSTCSTLSGSVHVTCPGCNPAGSGMPAKGSGIA